MAQVAGEPTHPYPYPTAPAVDPFVASSWGQEGATPPAGVRTMPSYVVYGLEVPDVETLRLARQVVLASLAMALMALISSIFSLLSGVYLSIGFVSAILIPLLGYFGTLKRKRWAVQAFSFLNTCCGTLFVASLIATLAAYRGDYISCLCDPKCRDERGLSPEEADTVCGQEGKYRALWW
jgi:hypothetical protein